MTAAPPAGSEAGPQHRRPDLRLLAPAVGGWLAAAWAVGEPAGRSLPLSAAVGGLGLVLLGGRRAVVARVPAAACLVCVAGCLAAAGLRVYALRHGPLRELAGAHAGAELSVVVTGDPRAVAGKPRGSSRPLDLVVVPARAERVRAGAVSAGVRQPVLLLASGPGWTELLPSQHLLAAGRLAPARRGDMTSA
ncbi:MAG: MBL fold metallo-hydrolase, partial [Actinomycetota bacterium]|nr:MBL fold metallo-hydrolase [Actinomycetota bacterium]